MCLASVFFCFFLHSHRHFTTWNLIYLCDEDEEKNGRKFLVYFVMKWSEMFEVSWKPIDLLIVWCSHFHFDAWWIFYALFLSHKNAFGHSRPKLRVHRTSTSDCSAQMRINYDTKSGMRLLSCLDFLKWQGIIGKVSLRVDSPKRFNLCLKCMQLKVSHNNRQKQKLVIIA